MKLASCKSALNPRWFTLLTVLKRGGPGVSLTFVALWLFYEAICFMSYLVSFCSCVFLVFYDNRGDFDFDIVNFPFLDIASV